MPSTEPQQFILLPPRGLTADSIVPSTPAVRSFFSTLSTAMGTGSRSATLGAGRLRARMRVLDSIQDQGAKLVELSPDEVSALRAAQPGVRVVPVVYYRTAEAPRAAIRGGPTRGAASLGTRLSVRVVSIRGGTPVPRAEVVAFTDYEAGIGAQGTTNTQGVVHLALGGTRRKVQRLYVYSEGGYWNLLRKGVTLTSGGVIRMRPIDLNFTDSVRHFYGSAPLDAGHGVKVGVIDTGVGPHPDLVLDGGVNTVTGEDPADYGDNGDGHGTHVAGIIGARGTPPAGVRGVAPGVTLRSYRVFGRNSEGASNFAIAKAIDRAVRDGCDLINMSLGGGEPDEATHSAMASARAQGVVLLAANGNDGRQPVSSPAADSLALAVSALGRKGTYPPSVTQSAEAIRPWGRDRRNFIAAFSNIGPETDLTGPGVGVISTYPGGYAVLDGTSMACPAATGAAARQLAASPNLRSLRRDQARSDAVVAAILQAARSLGFGGTLEGRGLL